VTQTRRLDGHEPPAGSGGGADRFVYAVVEARGGVGAGVITVEIGKQTEPGSASGKATQGPPTS